MKDLEGVYQMVSIHVLKNKKSLPCVYAFLPNKTQESYSRLLDSVKKSIAEENYPKFIGTDFEQAIIHAATDCFVDVHVHG